MAPDKEQFLNVPIDQGVLDGCKFRQSRGRWFVETRPFPTLGYLEIAFLEPEPGGAGWGTSCQVVCCEHFDDHFGCLFSH